MVCRVATGYTKAEFSNTASDQTLPESEQSLIATESCLAILTRSRPALPCRSRHSSWLLCSSLSGSNRSKASCCVPAIASTRPELPQNLILQQTSTSLGTTPVTTTCVCRIHSWWKLWLLHFLKPVCWKNCVASSVWDLSPLPLDWQSTRKFGDDDTLHHEYWYRKWSLTSIYAAAQNSSLTDILCYAWMNNAICDFEPKQLYS